MTRMRSTLLLGAALVLGLCLPALAGQGGGMPWDGPLDQISANLSGPTARKLIIIAIATTGIVFCYSEGSHVFRKLLYIAAGIVLLAAGASWAMPFLGFAEGATAPRPVCPPMSLPLWLATLGTLVTLGTTLGLHWLRVDQRRGLLGTPIPQGNCHG